MNTRVQPATASAATARRAWNAEPGRSQRKVSLTRPGGTTPITTRSPWPGRNRSTHGIRFTRSAGLLTFTAGSSRRAIPPSPAPATVAGARTATSFPAAPPESCWLPVSSVMLRPPVMLACRPSAARAVAGGGGGPGRFSRGGSAVISWPPSRRTPGPCGRPGRHRSGRQPPSRGQCPGRAGRSPGRCPATGHPGRSP
jgi:hypothetical protein